MFKSSRLFDLKLLKAVSVIAEQTCNREKCFVLQQHIKPFTTFLPSKNDRIRLIICERKSFHTGVTLTKRRKDESDEHDEKRSLIYYQEFARFEKKDKKSFLEVVRLHKEHAGKRTGHVEFIKAAMQHMKEFGVHRDLETYKKLVDVLPKGVYISNNRFLVAGMYFPRQQFVILDLLRKMEINGVDIDVELGFMLDNIFGQDGSPSRKYRRMLYWTTKWKNKSPFPLPKPLPTDSFALAKLAIERITWVDLQTEISVFHTEKVEESIDKTWIVSGQSPKQKKLLSKHPKDIPVVVEEGELVWLLDKSINYFVLKADGEPLPFKMPEDKDDITNMKSKFCNPHTVKEEDVPSVHEQDDGIIYAVCATGTSSRDSLLSWIRILQNKGNPNLADVPVLFRFRQAESLPAPFTDELVKQE